MRENRPSGSEGGGTEPNRCSRPLSSLASLTVSKLTRPAAVWNRRGEVSLQGRGQFSQVCQHDSVCEQTAVVSRRDEQVPDNRLRNAT